MKKPIKVVLLPTENKSNVHIYENGNLFYTLNKVKATNKRHGYQAQHIYITVSQDVEPLKVGEKFMCLSSRILTVKQICDNGDIQSVESWGAAMCFFLPRECRKIISTNNPKLTQMREGNIIVDKDDIKKTQILSGVARIQQSFLKKYIANPDGEWEVEYESYKKQGGGSFDRIDPERICYHKLKVNQDNTVNITTVEEKMYSNEEVVKRSTSFFYWWFMERSKYVEKGTPLTAEQGYVKYLEYVKEYGREF